MRLLTFFQAALFCVVFWIGTLWANSSADDCVNDHFPLSRNAIITQLGWVQTGRNRCGGYYLEDPFNYPEKLLANNAIAVTSEHLLFALHGKSVSQGKLTISRFGQQLIANKAYLYRDPKTDRLKSTELFNGVTLRQPNSLVLANSGCFDFASKAGMLHNVLYRTAIYSSDATKPGPYCNNALQVPRKITQLSAWGEAKNLRQDNPKIFQLDQVSYSTCPPNMCVWQVKASRIVLNKETGRGTARNARVLVGGVPVVYTPYLNFPIDSRRQTGFLWPTAGTESKTGATYITTPFYWNMAPNYDMTITPAFLSKRGFQLKDYFRYLTPESRGNMGFEVLPHDREFQLFKGVERTQLQFDPNPVTQSELRRLEQASLTRKSFNWVNQTRFNEHWFNSVDYNWVSDDYYLKDFRNNLNQVTQNQLLQQAELEYKNQNWDVIGRIQGYQTLHPVDESVQFNNQYTRAPQIAIFGDYPDNPGGFEYFVNNDLTRFDIRNNPGSDLKFPMGNRFYTQPGVSRTFSQSWFSITPRFQYSMTQYRIGDVNNTESKIPSRTLPIFDMNMLFYFDRHIRFFGRRFSQTLEPQIYYVYIPFRNQNQLPIFDTTVNTLTYDQLFMYNRFSGLDRINDANQMAVGLTTRFIDQRTGTEKIRAALGQLFYFKRREVTLCGNEFDPFCQNPLDVPSNPNNRTTRSPLSGLLNYTVDRNWSVNANTIWDSKFNRVDNQSITFHYQPPSTSRILNLGYNFVRNGDILYVSEINRNAGNLSSTDISFDWPVFRDWTLVGRWTQNWNHHHFQNLLYGLQYDSCCWAVRFVTGRAFMNLNRNNVFQYNTQFYVQLALKGLGAVPLHGSDPNQFLSTSISGYVPNFGQDF